MKKSKNGKKIVTVMVMILMTMLVFAPSKYASAKTRYYVCFRDEPAATVQFYQPVTDIKLQGNRLTLNHYK